MAHLSFKNSCFQKNGISLASYYDFNGFDIVFHLSKFFHNCRSLYFILKKIWIIAALLVSLLMKNSLPIENFKMIFLDFEIECFQEVKDVFLNLALGCHFPLNLT